MAEQASRASNEQIVSSLMYIHEEVVQAALIPEMLFGGRLVSRTTDNVWSMDIREGCRLSIKDKHLQTYQQLDTELQDPDSMKVRIHLDLPAGREGNFTIGVNDGNCHFIDDDYLGPETLSRQGLFGLLGVRDERQMWNDLKRRARKEGVRKETAREVRYISPDASWPMIRTRETSVNGVVTAVYTHFRVGQSISGAIDFEGAVDLARADGRQTLEGYTFTEGVPPKCNERAPTVAQLATIGGMTLSLLNKHFGYSLQQMDGDGNKRPLAYSRDPKEIVGMDGKPNSDATEGYRFSVAWRMGAARGRS
ncbi:MAG TPA: hypothetical protein VLA92_04400 [Candidatus Saccharimonadales bacterium]|nr:hypothetical protein [Candidatus Saccharimonadales bacterium]